MASAIAYLLTLRVTLHEHPAGGKTITGRTYRDAGVDIDAGQALVNAIAPLARSTARPGMIGGLGGFAALFDLRAAGYTDPLLVAATDGVGTKLKVASAAGIHETIGIDLVAMCVNDLVVTGAEPLFFLDYFASGGLDVDVARSVVAGIAEGCRQAGCALIGGETAEMPGLYAGGDYDLAGFAVGAVDRDRVIDGTAVTAGDVVLGLASSGLHSNGFSLVRKVIADAGLDYREPAPFAGDMPLAAALLAPTRIYVRSCLAAIRSGAGTSGVRALAHITGGGLIDNIPRVLPAGFGVRLNAEAWPLPAVFRWLVTAGRLEAHELARTFNCGIGMVVIVAGSATDTVTAVLEDAGERVLRMGLVVPLGPGDPPVTLAGTRAAWGC